MFGALAFAGVAFAEPIRIVALEPMLKGAKK